MANIHKTAVRSLLVFGVSTTGLLMLVGPSQAQVHDARAAAFSGTIPDTCTVTVPTPGRLGHNASATVLSSAEPGGVSAQAVLTTNSPRASVQVIPPSAFDAAPSGSDADTTFTASYDMNGHHIDGLRTTALGAGINTLAVDATATKGSGAFAGGHYTLTATVRCITP